MFFNKKPKIETNQAASEYAFSVLTKRYGRNIRLFEFYDTEKEESKVILFMPMNSYDSRAFQNFELTKKQIFKNISKDLNAISHRVKDVIVSGESFVFEKGDKDPIFDEIPNVFTLPEHDIAIYSYFKINYLPE